MIYRFAECALDTQLHLLHRAGHSTRLAPKVFEVLCYLIEHRDRVVSKQELCDQVWEGFAISEATLESCLRAVRSTVGDSGQAQRIIQTQRGYGYRFVADVTPVASRGATEESLSPTPVSLEPLEDPAPTLSPSQSVAPQRPVPRSGVRLCVACQHANDEPAIFCAACGTRLRQLCVHCGQDVTLPAVFCTACGQPLAAPAPSSPVPAPPGQAERKPVTVLCCTVTTATTHAARVDLDVLHSLLLALHALAQDVVRQYGGRLHPVMGARLMAMFGVPVAHEDDARRAVRVALELRRRLSAHQERLGTAPGMPVALRMGLHTGLVVVGGLRNGDDTETAAAVVGDVVSLATALEERAEPGTILCSAATARLIQDAARLEAIGPVQVPGQPAGAEVYQVLGRRFRRSPGERHRGRVLSPFVGRDRELATLHALLAQVEEGRGQVVGVVGEAGLGKSRLVYEFTRSLGRRRLAYRAGRCLSYASTMPYLPVLDLLRHHCGITDTDGPEDITVKVHRGLQEVDMAPETWAPVLLHLLGLEEGTNPLVALGPEARKARILNVLTQMCLNGSRQRPLILEVEDLHWIDASSDECLAALIERMAGAPVLVLVTYRPGYRPAWIDKSYATQVALQPLTSQDSLRVVQAVLPRIARSAPLVPQLLAKADGNPFFLEELARTVVEQGADAPSPTVPDTVQAVLLARIDRLPATAKRLLQTVAVIGKDVALPLLQAVTEVSEEAMHRDLRHLQAAEFLYETYAPTALAYTFKHALTHEVAYSGLLQERRRTLHARIVEALERLAADRLVEQVDRLAHHALRGEVWAKAVPYCQQAGARAWDRAAFREAVAAFEQALQALAHLPEDAAARVLALDLRLAMDRPLSALGAYGRRLALLGEAETLARMLDDRIRLGRVLALMGHVRRQMGDNDGALVAGHQALELAVALGQSALQGYASYYLGQAYEVLGDFGRAAELQRRSIEEADREAGTSNTDARSQTRARLTTILGALGTFVEGRRHGEEALRLATRAGRGLTPIIAHLCLGELCLTQGDLDLAIRVLDQGLTLCRASGNLANLRRIAAGLGYACALQGRLEEGRVLLEEAISKSIHTGARRGPRWFAWLSEVYRLAGREAEASHHAHQALELARQQQERGEESLARHQLGVVHAHADPPDVMQAALHYQQALALAEELGMRPLQAHCHRGLGTLYAATGQQEQARTALATAIEMYAHSALRADSWNISPFLRDRLVARLRHTCRA